jgi:hypothetical protein
MATTSAPNSLSKAGADLYEAPLAQSKNIFIPDKLNDLGKKFLSTSVYLSVASSILLALPIKFGFNKYF